MVSNAIARMKCAPRVSAAYIQEEREPYAAVVFAKVRAMLRHAEVYRQRRQHTARHARQEVMHTLRRGASVNGKRNGGARRRMPGGSGGAAASHGGAARVAAALRGGSALEKDKGATARAGARRYICAICAVKRQHIRAAARWRGAAQRGRRHVVIRYSQRARLSFTMKREGSARRAAARSAARTRCAHEKYNAMLQYGSAAAAG